MDIERSLISKIIQDGNFAPCAEKSITEEFFQEPKNKHVFNTIVRHQAEYNRAPSLGAIRMDHPDYKFMHVEDDYDFLLDKIREARSLTILEHGLSAGISLYDGRDVEGVKSVLHEALNQVASDVPNGRDVNFTMTGMERMQKYLDLRDNDGALLGIPTGFSTLDRATQGFQPEQLNFFVGPPKAGKTTLMLLASIAAHLHGVRPLVFTFEMSDSELSARLDSFRAGISHERLRNGSLKKSEWEALDRYMRSLESMPDYWLSADSTGASSLTGIGAKIDTYKPGIVFIDGLYMLTDEQTGEQNTSGALTNITRGLKRLSQKKRLCINASTQVLEWKMDKTKGITSNSIGYSSSFAQDGDNIFGIEKTEDEQIQKVKVVLSRNSPPRETYIQWDWETGSFEELSDNPFEAIEDGGGWDAAAAGF